MYCVWKKWPFDYAPFAAQGIGRDWALEGLGVKEVKEKDGWRDELDERSTRTSSSARPPRVRVNDSTGLAREYRNLQGMVEIGGGTAIRKDQTAGLRSGKKSKTARLRPKRAAPDLRLLQPPRPRTASGRRTLRSGRSWRKRQRPRREGSWSSGSRKPTGRFAAAFSRLVALPLAVLWRVPRSADIELAYFMTRIVMGFELTMSSSVFRNGFCLRATRIVYAPGFVRTYSFVISNCSSLDLPGGRV